VVDVVWEGKQWVMVRCGEPVTVAVFADR